MPETVYGLCAATSLICVVLLVRSHRQAPTRLLLWSALCFAGLALNNILLVADRILVPDLDLALWRTGAAEVALLLLVIGLISEER